MGDRDENDDGEKALADLLSGQSPVSEAVQRHRDADDQAADLRSDLRPGQGDEVKVAVEVRAKLRRESVEQKRAGEHLGEEDEPIVAVQGRDQRAAEHREKHEREPDQTVDPEQVVLLVAAQVAYLYGGRRQPEVAQHLADADDRGD